MGFSVISYSIGGPSASDTPMEISDSDGPRCFIDSSWKESVIFSGLVRFYFQGTTEGTLMGSKKLRRSLPPLHAELEKLILAIHSQIFHQKTAVAFATNCSELVKMVYVPAEWPAFAVDLEEFARSKEFSRLFRYRISLVLTIQRRIC